MKKSISCLLFWSFAIFSNFTPTQNGTRTLWVGVKIENLGKIPKKSNKSQFFHSLCTQLKGITMSISKLFFFVGAFFAMLSVILGAFGAHALKQRISSDMLSIFEVGVRYQMYHALGLIILALAMQHFQGFSLEIAGWLFIVGTLLFSGSLYILSLSGNTLWGAVTPIGGLFWIIAWLFVCYTPFRN